MSSDRAAFAKSWARTFSWVGLLPAVVCVVLALIPGGQLLALLPAYLLSLPGALLIGQPHFSPEFGIPLTATGFLITVATWLAISGLVAAVLAARKTKARGDGGL
jgi:hypothetical protein